VKKCSSPNNPDPRSILVVLPTWVGDFVMATPTLRAIRTRFPNARIALLAEPNLRDLICGGDWMDECFEWPRVGRRKPWHLEYRTLARELRGRRLDWAVLLPNSFRAALIARLGGARRRIGYNRDRRGFLLTDGLEPANHVDGRFAPVPLVEYYADLAEAIGCDRPQDTFELFTTPREDQTVEKLLKSPEQRPGGPLVVISPGARYGAAKCWAPERFAAVADRLVEESGAVVVVTCGPGEEHLARAIAAAAERPLRVFDDPRLTLGELKSLIKRCDLLICNDTGPRHFAKAFNVPVVTVFGPTHPQWTATSYRAERIVRIEVDCGPCQAKVCPLGHVKCMTGVTPEAVYEAATDLLASSVLRGA